MPLALWYLAFDGRKWFDPEYLAHMTAGEKAETWTTRVFYGIPKIGVVIGLVSLFKFRRYSLPIYLACWLFAIGHTALYYRGFRVPITGEIEWLRLTVHHIIPHLFFAGVLLSLYWFRRRSFH